jgi:polyhydroxyalkanoate synthesis regulator phasin
VTVTGEITVGSCSGCTSDIRLKKDVKPLKGAIDQLLALKGVTFEWKNPEEHEGHSGTQTGFIAQDVQKLFPEWVKDGGYTAPDGQKYKTLDTRQIEALEVESIRTLRSDNEKQQAQISELQEQVRALASGHPIPASGFNFGGTNVGLLGPAAAIAYAASRRKPNEKRA